jgi:hypothetical protein
MATAKIRVKNNGGTFSEELVAYAKGVQEASAQALTWTAYNTREAEYADWKANLDRPTPKTMRSILVKKASAKKPEAEVFTKFGGNKEVPPGRWLDALDAGGSRRMKSSEKALGSYVVPSKYMMLDAYGNVPGGVMKKILANLKLAGDQSSTNSAASKRKRRGETYFLQNGIVFRRTAHSVNGGGFSAIIPQLILVDNTPRYSKRIDWDGVALRTFERDYDRLFAKALAKAGIGGGT